MYAASNYILGGSIMNYSNSPLVEYTKLSPFNSGYRTCKIERITPHCVVGQVNIEALGDWFCRQDVKASSNYGIGKDGKIGLFVPEYSRSWCSSSSLNDNIAVTIECASDSKEPYAFNDVVYKRLIELCVDICKRNGKTKLLWINNRERALNYTPADDEMLLTVHRWFNPQKSCPGDWLYNRLGEVADKVTKQLNESDEYNIKGFISNLTSADALSIYKKALQPLMDNDASEWSIESRNWAIVNNIIQGDGKGNYNWEAPVSKEQVVAIIYRVLVSLNLIKK